MGRAWRGPGWDVLKEMWGSRSDFHIDGNLAGFDFVPALRKLPIPTLIILGDHDLVSSGATAEDDHAGTRNSKLVVLGHSGHMTFVDQTGSFLHQCRPSSTLIERVRPTGLGADVRALEAFGVAPRAIVPARPRCGCSAEDSMCTLYARAYITYTWAKIVSSPRPRSSSIEKALRISQFARWLRAPACHRWRCTGTSPTSAHC